ARRDPVIMRALEPLDGPGPGQQAGAVVGVENSVAGHVRPAGDRLGHSTFDHTAGIKTNAEAGEQRRAPAVAAYVVLGALIWASPLALGTLGLLLALAILVAIVGVQRDATTRLRRVGGYLLGGS